MFDENCDDEPVELTINKAYALRYDKWRRKEELQRLKDRYGDVDLDESESSSEEEDDTGEQWSEQLEQDWMRAYTALKNRDPAIYNQNSRFYSVDQNDVTKVKKQKQEKPLSAADMERQHLLEHGPEVPESEEDEAPPPGADSSTYVEEQARLKQSLLEAVGDDSDSDEEDLLTAKVKGKDKDSDSDEDEPSPADSALYKYFRQNNINEDDRYLGDFIMNKRYLDKGENDGLPSDEDISDDDSELEKQEHFERKYNFRFEEPDEDFIKQFPRTVESSVRRPDTRRAERRAEVRERKAREKERALDDVRELKMLKRRELEEQLDRLKHTAGLEGQGFSARDVTQDFDPAEHDRMMQDVFGDDYYGDSDGLKPVFAYDAEIDDEDDWDEWRAGKTGSAPSTAQPASAAEEPCSSHTQAAEKRPTTAETVRALLGGKARKKSAFRSAVEKRKPVFDPKTFKSFAEYVDEYYALDCEDVIGSQPCRFKYRSVEPNDYGLTAAEVLKAPENELNAWVSVKKMSQYLPAHQEAKELSKYRMRAKNITKKHRILPSLAVKTTVDDTLRVSKTTLESSMLPQPGLQVTRDYICNRR